MNACAEIRKLLGRCVDGELDAAEARRVDEHVDACDACAEQLRLMEREAELIGAALGSDEVPAGLGAGLWVRLRRRRRRWVNVGLSAAAAAAVVLVAFLIGLVAGPGPAVQVALVDACSGPLELATAEEDWKPLATYTVLGRGDRIRNDMPRPGRVILRGDQRIDLGYNTEIVTTDGDETSLSRIAMRWGDLHVELPNADRPFTVDTALAGVVVSPGSTGSEFELQLGGGEPEVGWLGRIHLLPAAHAAPRGPSLLVRVYRGRARAEGPAGRAVVRAGEEVILGEGAASPRAFDRATVVAWWRPGWAETAGRPEPLPLPPMPERRSAGERPSRPGPGPERSGEGDPDLGPSGPAEAEPGERPGPTPRSPRRPPAPTRLAAERDLTAVVLTWQPVRWERPIDEYHVYRSGPDGREFVLHDRVPPPKPEQSVAYRDERVSIGGEYRYQVAGAVRDDDGDPIVGAGSRVITASPLDFRIIYTGGGNDNVANIIVETLYKGRPVRKSFFVPKLDPVENESGQIGRRARVRIEPIPGTHQTIWVDFATGYRLLDIMTTREKDERGIPHKTRKVLIEDSAGRRRVLPAEPGR
ncbi:MAG: zf-HC2 domain-containing protein [Planctomycetota bacterium]